MPVSRLEYCIEQNDEGSEYNVRGRGEYFTPVCLMDNAADSRVMGGGSEYCMVSFSSNFVKFIAL